MGTLVNRPRVARWEGVGLSLLVLAVVWVQRRALGSFFGADDLIHLEQASGILRTPPIPWRVVTQVLYFRAMLPLFGPAPAWYMSVNLVLHAVNVILLYRLVNRLTTRRSVAFLAAGCFGAHPLHLEVLFRAVTINETASSACVLGAALSLARPHPRKLLGSTLFALGVLCKESVLGVPLGMAYTMYLISGGRRGLARVLPVGLIALATAVVFFLLRLVGLAPGGTIYAVQLGANVFHNAMTYLTWAVDLVHPVPDLVRSYDAQAWRPGLVALVVALPFAVRGPLRDIARWGVVWWASALLPVLVLQNAAYGHYAYLSLAGVAAVVAAVVGTLVSAAEGALASFRNRRLSPAGPAGGQATHPSPCALRGTVAAVLFVGLVLQADSLEGQRLRLSVPGTDLALDPFLRSIEVSRRAIVTFGQGLSPEATKAVIFVPEGTLKVFGARSGKEYAGASARREAYLFVEAVLDSGRAFRVFYPQVDSVRFLRTWSARYREWHLFVQEGNGYLVNLGVGPVAHGTYAQELLNEQLNESARGYLDELTSAFPDESAIRFFYASALARTGDRQRARVQLRELIARDPQGVLSGRSRGILRTTLR